MRFTELKPEFVKLTSQAPVTFQRVAELEDADGVIFLCPKCLQENGGSLVGVHSVLCWEPNVSAEIQPAPGRWTLTGTGLEDLTLVGVPSSSVQLVDGCSAHFHITNGEVIPA